MAAGGRWPLPTPTVFFPCFIKLHTVESHSHLPFQHYYSRLTRHLEFVNHENRAIVLMYKRKGDAVPGKRELAS